MNIIDLDTCVENALELFSHEKLPSIALSFKRPLVIGSGNAAVTGRIMFSDRNAVFADESNYTEKLKAVKEVDGAVLISASGGKHAPLLAKELKKRRIKTILLTNNASALAIPYVHQAHVFPRNTEPYTYNTSTYLSMILGKTGEDPRKIARLIKTVKVPNFKKFDSFFIIVPNDFDNIREMFLTKFDELFGSKITGRVFTVDQVKHAKTVVPNEKECFIGLGVQNKQWGAQRYNFALPRNAGPGTAILIGYWIIGQIQKQHPPYFKRNIEHYTKLVSKMFKQDIKPLV